MAGEDHIVRAVVVDHVSIRVRDLEASRRFYEAALAPLGFEQVYSDEGGAAFGLVHRAGEQMTSGSSRAVSHRLTSTSPSRRETGRRWTRSTAQL